MADRNECDPRDPHASPQELLARMYQQLKGLATRLVAKAGRKDITRSSIAHEVMIEWIENPPTLSDENHVLAAWCMCVNRQIINRIRHDDALKRGGDRVRVPISEELFGSKRERTIDLEEFHDNLEALGIALGPSIQEVLVLRTVGDLSIEETATALGISVAAVQRHYRIARAWFGERLMRRSQ